LTAMRPKQPPKPPEQPTEQPPEKTEQPDADLLESLEDLPLLRSELVNGKRVLTWVFPDGTTKPG